MTRSPAGLIGAVLLGSAALLAQSQDETPAKPAPAPTQSQSVSQSLGLIVYPAKGQSATQQSTDEQECYSWAKSNTGIDPQVPAPATAAAPAKDQAQAAQTQQRDTFKKALGPCLQGRGYTTG